MNGFTIYQRALILRRLAIGFAVVLAVLYAGAAGLTLSPSLEAPAVAQTEGAVPGSSLGNTNDAEFWRQVRKGATGKVSIPDDKAAFLVQSEGDNWRAWRNGPILVVGAITFWVMFFVVYGFYMLRGTIKIRMGKAGRKILRFTTLERFAHWLTAGSFIILAITGVNMLYGRLVVRFFQQLTVGRTPGTMQGSETYATLTEIGKYVHNYVAFAFMTGLLLIFVLWVRDNVWDKYDWGWIKKGGGLLFPTEHPPADKFNFGQKTVFWAVMIGGGVLSFTGLNLLFPFVLFDLQAQQWIQAIHATVSQILCMMMVAHIYIGTVGMEDAIDTMTDGYVDENWAKEHHSAWLEKLRRKGKLEYQQPPADQPPAPEQTAPAE